MRRLNKDKIQVRYITGINKVQPGYPTPLDILYDACTSCAEDDKMFSREKVENTYFFQETDSDLIGKKVDCIFDSLIESGYIEKNGSSYKIIKTIWD